MKMINDDKYIIKYIKTKNKVRKIITYSSIKEKEHHIYISNRIKCYFKPSIYAKGYIEKESIFTNAKAHLYNNYFIKTDIKDFFQSINLNTLRKLLYMEIHDIASPKDCEKIINDCSVYKRGIPLGFVTSPLLANIYLKKFDLLLYHKLKSLKCDNIIYTRYADDLIISFKSCKDLKEIYEKVITIIDNLLNELHLRLNSKKTKLIDFDRSKQVRITGITIVEKNGQRKLSIGRNNKRKLFYRAINVLKNDNEYNDELEKKKIKGLMSFYLSVEKTDFDDFLSDNMKKELRDLGCDNMIDLINKL